MILIIAGSRNINDYDMVKPLIDAFLVYGVREVVSGGANGVDKLGELWAYENNVPCTVMKAKWHLYGNKAGPMRNREMARYANERARLMLDGRAGCLVIRNAVSPGSEHMAATARADGLIVMEHIL